jgi:hypothetical protein
MQSGSKSILLFLFLKTKSDMNMKKTLIATLFLFVFSLAVKAQNALGITSGTKIVYEVTLSQKVRYDMTITVKSMSTESVTFDWYGNGKTGSFTLNKKALTSATNLICDFKNGNAGKWDNQAAIIFPMNAFNELNNKGVTSAKINNEKSAKSFRKVMNRSYEYTHNGEKKSCNVILGAYEGGEKNYIVLVSNDKNLPLLVAMDWNIRITLKSVKTA